MSQGLRPQPQYDRGATGARYVMHLYSTEVPGAVATRTVAADDHLSAEMIACTTWRRHVARLSGASPYDQWSLWCDHGDGRALEYVTSRRRHEVGRS